jgi:hypothetical protein
MIPGECQKSVPKAPPVLKNHPEGEQTGELDAPPPSLSGNVYCIIAGT